jgi:acyl carrier protein
MKLSYTILNIIKKKLPHSNLAADSRLFADLNLDSLEFVKLITHIEKKTKTKINLAKINNFENMKIDKFIKLFVR